MIEWTNAVRVAVTGFSIVFLCLAILMVVMKVMSFLLRPVRRKEALEAGARPGAEPVVQGKG